MKSVIIIAFTVFATFFMTVEGEYSEMPMHEICSIQGSGTATFLDDDSFYSGKMTMKRTNGAAIYNFSFQDSQQMDCPAYLLLRPDLRLSIFSQDYDGGGYHHMSSSDYYPLTSYSFADGFKPVPDMKYICYARNVRRGGGKDAAMLFSTDNKKLIGEWFNFSYPDTPTYLTIIYDKVEMFEHDTVDDTFSVDYDDEPEAKKPASEALTSMCTSSLVIPSIIAFLVTMVASSLLNKT